MNAAAHGTAAAQYAAAGWCGVTAGRTRAPRSQPISRTMTSTLQCMPTRMPATRPSGMVCFI